MTIAIYFVYLSDRDMNKSPSKKLYGLKRLLITIEIIMCQSSESWFARDVTAAMLEVKNKSISLLRELNPIFM